MPVSTDDLKPGLIAKARKAGRWVCRRILGFQQYGKSRRWEVEQYKTGCPGRTRLYVTPSSLASWAELLVPDPQVALPTYTGHHRVVWSGLESSEPASSLEATCARS